MILQKCSYTSHLLHEQTQSKNGLYCLCKSRECKGIITFAFRTKWAKSFKCRNCTTFATPLYVIQMYTFTTHLLRAIILYKCVLLHYICLHKQTAGKSGHYRLCTYCKHRAKHEICFEANLVEVKQMRSLRHLCYRFATRENPFFRPVYRICRYPLRQIERF